MNLRIQPTYQSNHLVRIFLTFEPTEATSLLQLPAWRPGRYEIANFAGKIYKLIARQGEQEIVCTKTRKDRWKLEAETGAPVEIAYDFYAYQMDAGGSWCDEEQLYLNFINCIPIIVGKEEEPIELEIDLPDSFRVATSLAPKQTNTWLARNHAELADSPLMASAFLQHNSYEVDGTLFHIWANTDAELPLEAWVKDFSEFTAVQMELFSGFPNPEFHFLLQLLPYKHYHGVEHQNSTVITLGPVETITERKNYLNLLGVASHELFHCWNVTRIRPKELLPYDFAQETYFQTGYIAEGVTTYYGDLMLLKSGGFTKGEYLDEFNVYLKRHYLNFGHRNYGLKEASIDLWVDGYQRMAPNRTVSIYIKGVLVAFLLDMEIRKRTRNEDSLESVLHSFWKMYGSMHAGYDSEDFQALLEGTTGTSWDDFFDQYVEGRADLTPALSDALAFLGLELRPAHPRDELARRFGIQCSAINERANVVSIDPDSPAFELLSLDDELITVDGTPWTPESSFVGNEITLKIKRWGKTKEIRVPDANRYFFEFFEVGQTNAPTNIQKVVFKSWANQPF